MIQLPADYLERVYAGVLGKIIGVYLGRPFEGWTHVRIVRELGAITYYVHERLGKALIVPDDDISGTFTFLRAMSDYGYDPDLTPAQIGQTWLNYLIEGRTVLWWGGMGNSTEHTAYLRLKAGIPAPRSGSMALNGPVVAEQIGAQIFIDGWAMIAPADPERAADLAERAATVSHDGSAVHAARLLAAMESRAFVERDVHRLLETGLSVIPPDSLIAHVVQDVRSWHERYQDWQRTFEEIEARYGYDRYPGNCHVVPNHAVIIMSLLYGEDDFQEALMVANTAGWDTDCNSGNVGCLMGIKEGLAGLERGPDWRGPVADRLYLPTADGGRTVSDAVREAIEVARIGYSLAGEPFAPPKGGARYHFDLPGALQSFTLDESPECEGVAHLDNVPGHSKDGARSLAIHYTALARGRSARLQREILPDYQPASGYGMVACPTLYPGQTIRARLEADSANDQAVTARLFVKLRVSGNPSDLLRGYEKAVQPGGSAILEMPLDSQLASPIAFVGLELTSEERADGTVYLDWLHWDGVPTCRLTPEGQGTPWLASWVNAASRIIPDRGHALKVSQDEGTGLIIQGTREWDDYAVRATLTPHLARSWGLAARVQGLRRYYALRLAPGGKAQLIRELDGTSVLAEIPFAWELYRRYALEVKVRGDEIRGIVDGEMLLLARDDRLTSGAVAILIQEGCLGVDEVEIAPL